MLLNFSEILWFVLWTIKLDFNDDEQQEIYQVLNTEIKDSECKCFTGRISRLVNCLNGFYRLVSTKSNSDKQTVYFWKLLMKFCTKLLEYQ